MKSISVSYSADGVITKVRPVKFRELEGKTIMEAIDFVNNPSNAERLKAMVEFFNGRIMDIKESCLLYGIKSEL